MGWEENETKMKIERKIYTLHYAESESVAYDLHLHDCFVSVVCGDSQHSNTSLSCA